MMNRDKYVRGGTSGTVANGFRFRQLEKVQVRKFFPNTANDRNMIGMIVK